MMRLGSMQCRHCQRWHPSAEYCGCDAEKAAMAADLDKMFERTVRQNEDPGSVHQERGRPGSIGEDVVDASYPRKKSIYVGAPACFVLERECQFIHRAFDGQCYLVGSALERPDWRDIDVRCIMDDEAFSALFPDVGDALWEFDPRWIILTTAISSQLSQQTGLPIDFQFQPRSHANDKHPGRRNALGLIFAKEERCAA